MTPVFARGLSALALSVFACTLGLAPAQATASTVVIGASSSGAIGSIAFVDPATGLDIDPAIPQVAFFPGHTDEGLSNLSGIAFHPQTGELWAVNYQCAVITIDVTTGASTPVIDNIEVPVPGSQCEGLAINAEGTVYTGHSADGSPATIAQLGDAGWEPNMSNTLGYVSWLAYEPVSDRIFVGDYTGDQMVIKSVRAADLLDLQTVGTDSNFLSSVAFGPSGSVLGGYWGDTFYTGSFAEFPGGMTSTEAETPSAYWLAVNFADETDPSEESEGPTALADTGVTDYTIAIAGALGVLGVAVAATARRRVR